MYKFGVIALFQASLVFGKFKINFDLTRMQSILIFSYKKVFYFTIFKIISIIFVNCKPNKKLIFCLRSVPHLQLYLINYKNVFYLIFVGNI